MKTFTLWSLVSTGCFFIVTLIGCSSAEMDTASATTIPPTATVVPPTATAVPPTATAVPPTATAVPPTEKPTRIPMPSSCDEIEGGCLKVVFTGQRCVYDGPVNFTPDLITLILINSSSVEAYISLYEHQGDTTIQDMINLDEAGYFVSEFWAKRNSFPLPGDTSFVLEKRLFEGKTFSLMCERDTPYMKTWYGGSFIVENVE